MNDTMAAKMRAARDQVDNIDPKHPASGDGAFFVQPSGDVHRIDFELQGNRTCIQKDGETTRIDNMLSRRKQRHEEAWNIYTENKRSAAQAFNERLKSAAENTKNELESLDARVESLMQIFDQNQLMELEEHEVHKIWDEIQNDCVPQIHEVIDAYERKAAEIDKGRKDEMNQAIKLMVRELTEVAHVCEGDVERKMEEEVLELDRSLLDNKRCVSDLVQRIKLEEIEKEKRRHIRYSDGALRWRKLRTDHGIDTFVNRINSREFTECDQMMNIFAEIRTLQSSTFDNTLSEALKMSALVSELSCDSVQQWRAQCQAILEKWDDDRALLLQRMASCEQTVEAEAQAAFRTLEMNTATYHGYKADELSQILTEKCVTVLTRRRENSEKLISNTESFLLAQAEEWWKLVKGLGLFMKNLVDTHDWYLEKTHSNSSGVRTALAQTRQQFEDGDREREEALNQAIQSVAHCHSETALDQRVSEGLECLDRIEEGYRQFHAMVTALLDHYPKTVQKLNSDYKGRLLEILRLATGKETQTTEQTESTSGDSPDTEEKERGDGEEKEKGTSSLPSVSSSRAPTPQVFCTPSGDEYLITGDVFSSIINAISQQESSTCVENVEAADESEEKVAEPTEEKENGDENQEGEEIREGTCESIEITSKDAPTGVDEEPLCNVLDTEVDSLREALQTIQVIMLADMDHCAAVSKTEAEDFTEATEVQTTEELDENLRSHRPRAGQLEEGVRQKRAVELIGQKRTMEIHLQEQSKNAKKKQAHFDACFAQGKKDMDASVAKLKRYEELVQACPSLAAFEIRKREIEGLNFSAKKVEPPCNQLVELSGELCQKLQAANVAFGTKLKSFGEGGNYADQNIDRYRDKLARMDAAVAAIDDEQRNRIEETRQEYAKKVQAYRLLIASFYLFKLIGNSLKRNGYVQAEELLEAIQASFPDHRRDLSLIGSLDRAIESTKSEAEVAFEGSVSRARRIEQLVEKLSMFQQWKTTKPGEQPKVEEIKTIIEEERKYLQGLAVAGDGKEVDEDIGTPTPSASHEDLAECCALLSSMSSLRLELACHAVELNVGRTDLKGLAKGIHPALRAFGLVGDINCDRSVSRDNGTETAPEVKEMKVVVEQLIAGCIDQVNKVGSEYYAGKKSDAVITRPNRIPASLEELKKNTEAVMGELNVRLSNHVQQAIEDVKVQVIRFYRQLEILPTSAMRLLVVHDLNHVKEECKCWSLKYSSEYQQLGAKKLAHEASLHPNMSSHLRKPALEAIKEQEMERQTSSVDFLKIASNELFKIFGQGINEVISHLCCLGTSLLELLDGVVMPADLPEIEEQLISKTQDITRKNMKELKNTSDSLQKVQGEVTEPAKDGGRPFAQMKWQLNLPVMDMDYMGWTEEQRTTLGTDAEIIAEDHSKTSPISLDSPCHREAVRGIEVLALWVGKELRDLSIEHLATLTRWKREEEAWATCWSELLQKIES
ncbi:hypothetical protein BSKO_08893 [Bryopsis sp. KO-2023]|nr:hypothetical protein BSKO_08893 [Bryopsis sp. KO-2023]